MTVYELNKYMNERIPKELSCSWDNDGLMCCPDGNREVKKVLFCMDVTPEAIDYAIENGYDLIISHHPLIFKGVKSVSGDFGIPSRIIKLIKNDVSVMSFHTRFDAVDGGVNDALAEIFGLSDIEKVLCDGIEMMRIGDLENEMTIEEFAVLKKSLVVNTSILLLIQVKFVVLPFLAAVVAVILEMLNMLVLTHIFLVKLVIITSLIAKICISILLRQDTILPKILHLKTLRNLFFLQTKL